VQLVQKEKLSALGELVAGVAHEVNNPIGCVIGNIDAVECSLGDYRDLIDLYGQHFPQPGAEIEKKVREIDLEYLREDVPKIIKAMKDAGNRIVAISKSLRAFSRADVAVKQAFNLHEGIDSTLLILHHRLKDNEHRPEIKIVTDFGDIPDVPCFPGQLNQMFMNIIANAIDALDESNQGRSFDEIKASPNQIIIQTILEGSEIKITIIDNGKGMPEAIKARIFEPLFTTKGVGKGTGLGLAIAYQIAVEKHGGRLEVRSELGQGTEFCIRLPITDATSLLMD
jgi:signal transduction histidine kinase